jgi:hypothetical protein
MTKPKDNSVYRFQGNGLTKIEVKWGRKRFDEYCQNYPHLHKMSDLMLLEELIFQEALHERIKDRISKITETKNEDNKITDTNIPSSLQDALKDSLDIQFKLKDKLGLFEDKAKLDAYSDFEALREDFKEYRRRNPHLFKTTCPKCAFIFFLKRRTDAYEEIDSPWFKDKVLCNPELWDAYKCGEITKLRTANILGVSEDCIDWLGEKIFTAKKEQSFSDKTSLETLSLPEDYSDEE